MSALLLPAVLGAGGEARVALSANHLLAVEGLRQGGEGGVEHTATEAEDQVEGGLLLDVVVGKGAAILELLAREDQTLLVRRDALLVLDLLLDIINRVRGLDL
eukprot:CAMPEP_0173177652 /NCGR_PEP_ID=MMETSP1141-20130122/5106_1 /TAXON_ID=483371 /ORGANISM="non described non described, Strain CCMP2298" /LENGTH=102 /DNA_ID=CAMNT_0014100069 /DNA_START=137 /DNA_END=445 /DNA_ORIENTATION=+